jgi:hypothetical protein
MLLGSWEHVKEPLDYIEGWEFLYQLNDYQFLKKDSVP